MSCDGAFVCDGVNSRAVVTTLDARLILLLEQLLVALAVVVRVVQRVLTLSVLLPLPSLHLGVADVVCVARLAGGGAANRTPQKQREQLSKQPGGKVGRLCHSRWKLSIYVMFEGTWLSHGGHVRVA